MLGFAGIVFTVAIILRYWQGQSQVPEAIGSLRKFFDAIEFHQEPSRWKPYLSQSMQKSLLEQKWDEGQLLHSTFSMNWSDRALATDWSDRVHGRFCFFSGKIDIEYSRDNMGPYIVTLVKEGNQWVIEGNPTHINELE